MAPRLKLLPSPYGRSRLAQAFSKGGHSLFSEMCRTAINQEDSELPARLITSAMEKLSAEAIRRLWNTSKQLERDPGSWRCEELALQPYHRRLKQGSIEFPPGQAYIPL